MRKPILASGITLRLHSSCWLWGWCTAFSIGVVGCLYACLPWTWATVLCLAYAASFAWYWTQWPGTAWPTSIHTCELDVHGQFIVTNATGQRWQCSVAEDSVVHPWLLALHLQAYTRIEADTPKKLDRPIQAAFCHQPAWLLILADQVSTQADKQALKTLRIWLRWGRAQEHTG